MFADPVSNRLAGSALYRACAPRARTLTPHASVPPVLPPPPGEDLDGRVTAELTRRGVIAAGGGLLVAASGVGLGAGVLGTAGSASAVAVPSGGASRTSRLTRGTSLVHADLHNHTLLSDGDGDPADAFVSMRAAGLDVAALTDHATLSDNLLGDVATGALPPEYTQLGGLTPGRLAAHAASWPTPRTAPAASPRSAASSGPSRRWAT